MTILGVDTSNHDVSRNGGRTLDYAAMRRAGVQYCWHKVSDGLNYYRDPTAPAALAAMRAALEVWGGYHVLWPNRSITGQLDWYFSILDQIAPGWRADPKYVVVLDCEPFGYNGGAPSIDQVNQAGDYALSKTGKRVGGYCPPWVYGSQLDSLRYPLISSSYGGNPATGFVSAYPGDSSSRWQATGKRRADVLQYGSRTSAGPHSTLDADAFPGSVDQLRALFNGGTDDMIDDATAFALRVAFADVYDHVHGINGQSWMAQAVETPLRNLTAAVPGIASAVQAIQTQLDAAATREQAALDALKALATVGGADIAPAVSAINAVGQQAEEQFAALRGQIDTLTKANADLAQRLAAAAAALAAAGAEVPPEVANTGTQTS